MDRHSYYPSVDGERRESGIYIKFSDKEKSYIDSKCDDNKIPRPEYIMRSIMKAEGVNKI